MTVANDEERYGTLVRRTHWLEDQCAIQRNEYDLEPEGLAYIKEQTFAMICEAFEMLQELPWKGGRNGVPLVDPIPEQLSRACAELVDVLIFLGNIAVALGFDDNSLWNAVNEKAVRNVTKRRGLGKQDSLKHTHKFELIAADGLACVYPGCDAVMTGATDPETELQIGRFK